MSVSLRTARLLTLSLLLCTAAAAQPADPAPADTAFTNAVLRLSGVGDLVADMPAMFDASLAEKAAHLSPEMQHRLREVARAAFDPAQMRQDLTAALHSRLDAQRGRAMLAVLSSPQAARMRALERAGQDVTPETLERFAEAVNPQDADTQERVRLAMQQIEAGKGVEMMLAMMETMGKAIAGGINQALPEAARVDMSGLEEAFAEHRAQQSEPLKGYLIVAFLYTYRDVPTAELEAYLAPYLTEDGRWYCGVLMEAIQEALAQGGRRMGTRLAASLSQ